MAKEKSGKVEVAALWKRHETLRIKADALQEQLSPINEEIKLIEQQLLTAIPEGKAKDGVMHSVRLGKSISWAKVMSEVKDRGLIAKTKFSELDSIVEENSKEMKSHKLEIA